MSVKEQDLVKIINKILKRGERSIAIPADKQDVIVEHFEGKGWEVSKNGLLLEFKGRQTLLLD